MRWLVGVLAACILPCCGGDVARDAADTGAGDASNDSADADSAPPPPCNFVCANAVGPCPPDCVAQCETYESADPCGPERVALWACAAALGKAYCNDAITLYVTSPALAPEQCKVEAQAAKVCACKSGGLLCAT